MEELIKNLTDLGTHAGGKLIFALLVLAVGKFVISKFVHIAARSKSIDKLEMTVKTFVLSFVKIGLWVVLILSIIEIMGVPMTSVVAVLASAGVAVGLALQGALSNVCGGIMIIIFKPFKVGDYIDTSGVQGIVKAVTIVYTVLVTYDNKRITVPNGALMNANIINHSAEELRRVDISVSCERGESPARIQSILMDAARNTPGVLETPEPFARIDRITDESMRFDVRVWCRTENFWDVYNDVTEAVGERLVTEGVRQPGVHLVSERV